MVQGSQRCCRPLEHRLLVIGRSADDSGTQMIVQECGAGDLHVGSHVISEPQRGEGIGSVLVEELRPRGDGVLRGVGRCAVAGADGVVLVVVVAHHPRHRGQIDHLVMVSSEYLSTCRLFPRHGLRLPLLHLRRVPTGLVDGLEVGDVVGGPVALASQPPRHVAAQTAARNLLEYPEGAVLGRLARRESVVVEHHPLVVVQTAVVQSVPLHPFLCRPTRHRKSGIPRGQTRCERGACPLVDGLWLDVFVQRLVPDGDGGLLDGETSGGDVEVVT